MALTIEAGWDFANVGEHTMTVTEATGSLAFRVGADDAGVYHQTSAGGSEVVVDSDTRWCHSDLTGVLGTGEYDDFAGALKAALDAGSAANGNGWTYTVTWSTSAQTYTISAAEGNTALTFSTLSTEGTRMRQLLGFSGDESSAASNASDVTPYYAITASQGAKSNVKRQHHQGGMISGAVSAGGTHYSIGPESFTYGYDFELMFEAEAIVLADEAAAANPWTYQHLWEHCQGSEPFLVRDGSASINSVHYLRAEAAKWDMTRHKQDWDMWFLTFKTFYEGTI